MEAILSQGPRAEEVAALEAPTMIGGVARAYLGQGPVVDAEGRAFQARSWVYTRAGREIRLDVDAHLFAVRGIASEEAKVLTAFDSTPA